MKISIIGCGYVGLVSGVCLSSFGHKIYCVDNNVKIIEELNKGNLTIYEKNLKKIFKKNLNKNFFVTSDIEKSILNSSITIVAVGTPLKNNKIDYSVIKSVTSKIADILRKKKTYHLIAIKSTVLPTTTEKIIMPILQKQSKKILCKDFGIVVNPEFLREGMAVHDFLLPDRIVIGGLDKKSINIMRRVYLRFNNKIILKTNLRTAEMIKCSSNSLLATLVSFSNEIANLSSKVGKIDPKNMFKGICLDRRITSFLPSGKKHQAEISKYLQAGPGFGGSCLPKDITSLYTFGVNNNKKMSLLKSVIKINNDQHLELLRIIRKEFKKIKGLKISILGLSFKADTDDIRESPSIKLIHELIKYNVFLKLYDPVAKKNSKKILPSNKFITYSKDLGSAIRKVDAVILMTNWNNFKNLPILIKKHNKNTLFIDARRSFSSVDFHKYSSIGL